jgi:hypothetical protein
MVSLREDLQLDGVPILRLESDALRVDVAPGVGGRVVSLVEKGGGHEFLWRNRALRLERLAPASEYDPNFFGGIDELLPNDLPEEISGVACPDHGELWTLPLGWGWEGKRLKLTGTLPRFGLRYERTMSLRADGPFLDLDYRISNPTAHPRPFLWKLHAALAVEADDVIDCPARHAQVVDLNYSRFSLPAPFAWPELEGKSANVIPPADGTMDFFYLFDLREGRLAWRRPRERLEFAYRFDTRVFPYAWLFASYGGFLGHYTAVLEPCTAMPLSVNEAASKNQCSVLQPGETLETRVSIRAGGGNPNPP